MTVREILTTWLKEHGYDGLWHAWAECGCDLDDLLWCDGDCHECEPAYRQPGENEDGVGTLMGPEKPEKLVPQPRNRARCKNCGDIIESKHRHDFVYCKCKSIAVDGGKDYRRRVGKLELAEEMP